MASSPKITAPDVTGWISTGRNVQYTVLDGLLFIAVPIKAETIAASPTSKSGKSKSIGTTEGNVAIAGTALKMGVNVYTPV